MVIHNSFADFVLFLYIHMAHADGEYHQDEENVISYKLKKLFPRETDLNKKLEAGKAIYKGLGLPHSQISGLIRDTFRQYPGIMFSQKYHVYTDMYDIIHADGKVHEAEQRALDELKEIIDISAEVSHH